jgi:hypothetical protein
MNVEAAEKAYFNDPAFHQMTKAIYNALKEMALTPSEVRDAAMLACIKFEMEFSRRPCFGRREEKDK